MQAPTALGADDEIGIRAENVRYNGPFPIIALAAVEGDERADLFCQRQEAFAADEADINDAAATALRAGPPPS